MTNRTETIEFIINSFSKVHKEKIADMNKCVNLLQADEPLTGDTLRNMLGNDPRFTKMMAQELLYICKNELVVHGGPLIEFLKNKN